MTPVEYVGKNVSVWQIHALKDNYIYILVDRAKKNVTVVDPSEAEPVFQFLKSKNLRVNQIWNTHHHPDHVGGNFQLQDKFNCRIFCSAYDLARVPGATQTLTDNSTVEMGQTKFKVLDVPGHTKGAIAFYSSDEKMAFTGDTLFSLGCGRLFEGTPEQMWQSLQRLSQLPDDTAIYCGHEYTLQNVAFAMQLPENAQKLGPLRTKESAAKALVAKGKPTVPSRLSEEKALNPFLTAKDLADFTRLRRLKDEFRLEP